MESGKKMGVVVDAISYDEIYLDSEEKENDKIIQLTKTEEWYFGFGKRRFKQSF